MGVVLPAASTERPPIVTAPIRGKVIWPFSETHASVVRSGFWQTVMRTTSSTPSTRSGTRRRVRQGDAPRADEEQETASLRTPYASGG
jgi:hypothetical protein